MLAIILLLLLQNPATLREGERRLLDAKAVPAAGASESAFAPKGWRVEATQHGDLNGDGRADAAVQLVEDMPLEGKDGVWNERHRALLVLLRRPDNSFARAAVAARLLYCSTCAGVLGDPSGGNISVEIKNGVLNVSQLSGSREATEHTWRFRHDARAGRFLLIGEDVEHHDRLTGDSNTVSTNHLNGLRVTTVSKVLKEGQEPRVVSTKRTRVRAARRFIEDVDYER